MVSLVSEPVNALGTPKKALLLLVASDRIAQAATCVLNGMKDDISGTTGGHGRLRSPCTSTARNRG
jgi:hypothetical protein